MTINKIDNPRISKEKLISFIKQNDLSRDVMRQNRLAKTHFLKYGGDTYEIHENVFSPKIFFDGFNAFVHGLKQEFLENKTFLEIGTGCGIIALHLLKHTNLKEVTMNDIFEESIECAKVNACTLGLSEKCKFIVSDVFNNLSESDGKFDIIFWNYPWLPEVDDYQHVDKLDKSLFDPGYKIIERYIAESNNYLNLNGKVFFGFGDYGHWELLKIICSKYSVIPKVVYEEIGEEGATVKYQLVELKRM